MVEDRIGDLGGLKIRLASWLPADERYQRRYLPVDFQSEVASGEQALAPVPKFRPFAMRSWRGGEGATWWQRDSNEYRESSNVRPVSIRDGLELGARQVLDPAAGGGTFSDARRFGYGLGGLFTVEDGAGYPWDAVNNEWDAGITTGAGTSDVASLTDGDDTWVYSGHENGGIHRWKTGSNEEHFNDTGAFVFPPILRSFAGTLYALDGDDLYTIDKVTPDTRVQVADLAGSSAVYLASTPWAYGRMSLSDKGPIWVQRLDNGQTFLWEFNHASETQARIGKLPVDFAFPYSIFFTRGFTFVAFRYASAHAQSGPAYLWYRRGAQDGVAGPFRSLTGVTASKPILIAGMIGDDILVYFDGAVWAYNLSDGAIYMMARQTSSGTPEDAITFGKDVFIAPVSLSVANRVERFSTTEYTTETATIDLGKHDWDYPGLPKILLDITVITDPLPANTSIQAAVAVDGGAFTNIGAASTTDGETKHEWTVSSSAGSTLSGNEFELRLILASTSTSATPTVREVSARAKASAHIVEIVMAVDCADVGEQASYQLIDGLNLLAAPAAPEVVAFTDPFQQRESDAADSFDVTVQEVITPKLDEGDAEEHRSAVVKLQAVSLV